MVAAPETVGQPGAATANRPRFAHNPALDGIRGIAVAIVVVYHTGLLHGGWIGVEVFFVLSGYLITSLLVGELDGAGRIDLLAFWRRRARRLLPALYLTLGVVAVFVLWVSPRTAYGTIRRDVIGALTYSSNWVSIFGGGGYWGQFNAPSPLRHMWSLAVEEQFYVVYPLLAIIVLRRHLRRVALPGLAVVALCWQLWSVRHVAVDRFYLGTDTRAFGILLGASVAIVPAHAWRRVATVMGPAALLWLAIASTQLDGAARRTFEGPFQLTSVAAAALVLAVRPGNAPWFGRALSAAPLTLLGRWSYGIYLFHWPIAEVLRQRWGFGDVRVTLLTVPLALLAAGASYRWYESPIRRRGLGSRRGATLIVSASAACALAALLATTIGAERPLTAAAVAEDAAPSVSSGDQTGAEMVDGLLRRPDDRAYRVMVVGDSVGASLAPAWTALQASAGIEVFSRAAPSCSYDRERTSDGAQFTEDQSCVDIVAGWRADVASFRPDVVLFVYGSWSGWSYQDAFRTQCDPVMAAHVSDLYAQAVADLASEGAHVLFVGPPYWRSNGVDPGLDDAYDCLTSVMHDFVATQPETTSFHDVKPLVCEGRDCDATANGQLARPDGLHFAGDAAITVAVDVLSSVLQPPEVGWPATVPIECCGD